MFLAGFRFTGILLLYVLPVPFIISLSFSDLHYSLGISPLPSSLFSSSSCSSLQLQESVY